MDSQKQNRTLYCRPAMREKLREFFQNVRSAYKRRKDEPQAPQCLTPKSAKGSNPEAKTHELTLKASQRAGIDGHKLARRTNKAIKAGRKGGIQIVTPPQEIRSQDRRRERRACLKAMHEARQLLIDDIAKCGDEAEKEILQGRLKGLEADIKGQKALIKEKFAAAQAIEGWSHVDV